MLMFSKFLLSVFSQVSKVIGTGNNNHNNKSEKSLYVYIALYNWKVIFTIVMTFSHSYSLRWHYKENISPSAIEETETQDNWITLIGEGQSQGKNPNLSEAKNRINKILQ